MTTTSNTTALASDRFVNFSQAAQELGISLWALRRRVARDGVQVYVGRDGRERLIERRELGRWAGIRPYSRQGSN